MWIVSTTSTDTYYPTNRCMDCGNQLPNGMNLCKLCKMDRLLNMVIQQNNSLETELKEIKKLLIEKPHK